MILIPNLHTDVHNYKLKIQKNFMNMFLWSLPKEKPRSSYSQNKNKEIWTGEMAQSLKILMTFQRTQVKYPVPMSCG